MLFQILLCCLLATTFASPTEEDAPVAEGQIRQIRDENNEKSQIKDYTDKQSMLTLRRKRSEEPTVLKSKSNIGKDSTSSSGSTSTKSTTTTTTTSSTASTTSDSEQDDHEDLFRLMKEFIEKYHTKMTGNNKVDYSKKHNLYVVHNPNSDKKLHIISLEHTSSGASDKTKSSTVKKTEEKSGNGSTGEGKTDTVETQYTSERDLGGETDKSPSGTGDKRTTRTEWTTNTQPKGNSGQLGNGKITESEKTVSGTGSGQSRSPGQPTSKPEQIIITGNNNTDLGGKTPITNNESGIKIKNDGSRDDDSGTGTPKVFHSTNNGYNKRYDSSNRDYQNKPSSKSNDNRFGTNNQQYTVTTVGNGYGNCNGRSSAQTYSTPTSYYGDQSSVNRDYYNNFPWNLYRNHTITNRIQLHIHPCDCGGYTCELGTIK